MLHFLFVEAILASATSIPNPNDKSQALFPWPQKVEWGGLNKLELPPCFKAGQAFNSTATATQNDRSAYELFNEKVRASDFELKEIDDDDEDGEEDKTRRNDDKGNQKPDLVCQGQVWIQSNDTDIQDADESYSLEVKECLNRPKFAQVVIKAKSVFGAMHAVTTLSQLAMSSLRAVTITDEPRFPHRGIMIDPSRNFLTPKTVKRIIDGMSFAKLNVLHVGFVNANSFLYEGTTDVVQTISKYGSMNSKKYSAKKVQQLIRYGLARGVQVVPEFDTPAHAFSWSQAPGYDKMVQCHTMEYQNAAACPEPPCGQLNSAEMGPEGLAFKTVRSVWKDMMSTMKQGGSRVHIGADEVNAFCWGGEVGDDWKTQDASKREAATKKSDEFFLPWVKDLSKWANDQGFNVQIWADGAQQESLYENKELKWTCTPTDKSNPADCTKCSQSWTQKVQAVDQNPELDASDEHCSPPSDDICRGCVCNHESGLFSGSSKINNVQFWGSSGAGWANAAGADAPLLVTNNTMNITGDGNEWPTGNWPRNYNTTSSPRAYESDSQKYRDLLKRGYHVVDSDSAKWYFDCGQPNFLLGTPSWCGDKKSWQSVYMHEPTLRLTSCERKLFEKRIQGGEVAMWGETATDSNILTELWPRASAAAERLWSPVEVTESSWLKNSTQVDTGRLSAQWRLRNHIKQIGQMIQALPPIQPYYCTHFDPNVCDHYTSTFDDDTFIPIPASSNAPTGSSTTSAPLIL